MKFIKFITSYFIKINKEELKKSIVDEIIAELETQKSVLSKIKVDELDEAYENGLSMAIYIVKDMI